MIDEFGRVVVVGENTAYPCRGQVDLVNRFGLEEGAHGSLLGQVQLGAAAGYQFDVVAGRQLPHQRRAHHPAVAGYIDTLLSLHPFIRLYRCGLAGC